MSEKADQLYKVALGLGSNLGDREATLRSTVALLGQRLSKMKVGELYQSPPLGGKEQPDYLNTAIVASTTLNPEQLLEAVKFLERQAGRPAEEERWASRVLDIDLLLFEDFVVDKRRLKIPHPGLATRAFALAPLADVAPDWVLPTTGQSVADTLSALICESVDASDQLERISSSRISWSRISRSQASPAAERKPTA